MEQSQEKVVLGYFFRPECGSEDRIGKDIGPFPDFFQMTYSELRVGPDGGSVAWYVHHSSEKPLRNSEGDKVSGWCVDERFGDMNEFWSDLVIYARPLKPGEKMIEIPG